MLYIDGVRYNTSERTGYKYITEVRYSDVLYFTGNKTCTKSAMVKYIIDNPNDVKTKFFSNNGYNGYQWIEGEDVRVVDNYYLRTDANNIKADNLGNLPEY